MRKEVKKIIVSGLFVNSALFAGGVVAPVAPIAPVVPIVVPVFIPIVIGGALFGVWRVETV